MLKTYTLMTKQDPIMQQAATETRTCRCKETCRLRDGTIRVYEVEREYTVKTGSYTIRKMAAEEVASLVDDYKRGVPKAALTRKYNIGLRRVNSILAQ